MTSAQVLHWLRAHADPEYGAFAAALLPADEKQAPARKAQVPVNLPSAAVCRTC